jgi:hypothetical protein
MKFGLRTYVAVLFQLKNFHALLPSVPQCPVSNHLRYSTFFGHSGRGQLYIFVSKFNSIQDIYLFTRIGFCFWKVATNHLLPTCVGRYSDRKGKLSRWEVHRCSLRPVFNNMSFPQGWSLPLGVNLVPRGELCPLWEMFTPSFTLYVLFRRMEGRTEDLQLWGQLHPWGSKICPLGRH